jgi:hypothetical protein
VQTINLSPPQIASTVSKERKNIDGVEVAQHSGVLLEGVDDGGIAARRATKFSNVPSFLAFSIVSANSANRNREEAGKAAAPPL